ncbi:15701_t:CDS:2, partial [Racocetra persica]
YKECSRYKKSKPIVEFQRLSRNKIQIYRLYNTCAEKEKLSKREKRLRGKSSYNENLPSLSLNEEILVNADSSEDELIYNMYDLEGFVLCKFRENEEKSDPVEFFTIVEIEKELVNDEILFLEFENEEQKFCNIVNALRLEALK